MRYNIIGITGGSGSGKTYLGMKLFHQIDDSFLIQTDSYYRDDILIKLLSIFFNDIYDRLISIKKKEILKQVDSLINKNKFITQYKYDFTNKK